VFFAPVIVGGDVVCSKSLAEEFSDDFADLKKLDRIGKRGGRDRDDMANALDSFYKEDGGGKRGRGNGM
jgi:hypothetical protein